MLLSAKNSVGFLGIPKMSLGFMIIPGTFLFDFGFVTIFVYGSSMLIGLTAFGETNFGGFFFDVDFLFFFGLPLAPPFSSPDVSSLVI
mgnify:CR=1 FL=1